MLSKIRLELARCPEYPEGSSRHGYLLTLPLDEDGRLDVTPGRAIGDRYRFERFWENEPTSVGHIERHGRGWSLSFADDSTETMNETIFRAEGHRILSGEYLSIRERDGEMRTFRIAAIFPAVIGG